MPARGAITLIPFKPETAQVPFDGGQGVAVVNLSFWFILIILKRNADQVHQVAADAIELERIPDNLLREPIEFIFADHFRQRSLCATLDKMIAEPKALTLRKRATTALRYLQKEMRFHIADEERSLFPLLARRAQPEDALDNLLVLLSEEHDRDRDMAKALIAALRQVISARLSPASDTFSGAALAFSETQRRHLSWENAVILPLARRRLTAEDMVTLGHEMAERRHIPYPE